MDQPDAGYRRWTTLAIMVATLSSLLLSGCSTQSWKRYSESRANPVTWVRDLFPPDGEYFYNEQSHEIERSLSRRQNVEMPQ